MARCHAWIEEAELGSVEDIRVAQVCLSADERVE
jgi:hypothetical protein